VELVEEDPTLWSVVLEKLGVVGVLQSVVFVGQTLERLTEIVLLGDIGVAFVEVNPVAGARIGHHEDAAPGLAVLAHLIDDPFDRRGILPDGHVNTDDLAVALVDDGVDGQAGLAGRAIADDELALAPSSYYLRAYRRKYGDLVADLRGDLSGDEYERAMRVLRLVLGDVAFESTCNQAQIDVVRVAVASAITKVDAAVALLAAGRSIWTATQASVFTTYFDPSGASFDDQFVADVMVNMHAVRRALAQPTFECEPAAGMCAVANRYGYTWWSNIHLCPYFFSSCA
jgi:hypothetical protein